MLNTLYLRADNSIMVLQIIQNCVHVIGLHDIYMVSHVILYHNLSIYQ
jgi:hypothetical protein